MYPGAFGDPSEDCNCCGCLLQRVKWALSEEEFYTKYDGDKNKLVRVEAKTYNEFIEKMQVYFMKMEFPDDVYKIGGFTVCFT